MLPLPAITPDALAAVPKQNRVTPYGEIVVSPLRGRWMGNRGCIHRGYDIVRPWSSKRWITCTLEFKGWLAPKWMPGRWTALFFYDEALSFAAGHRPCALCRRSDYDRYRTAVNLPGADAIDAQLHVERVENGRKRTHLMAWRDVPAGAYVDRDGTPCIVLDDSLRPWSLLRGYGNRCSRPAAGDASVLTPSLSLEAIVDGYPVQIADGLD